MKIIKVEPCGFASNSYILTADDKTAVVVDPGDFATIRALNDNKLDCKFVLLTHGHFDHVGACAELSERGALVCCGEREEKFIFSPENLSIFGGVNIPRFEIFRTFSDGENFSLCGINFTALSTPGHTSGGMCYIAGDSIFSGDTLFRCSVGRTDLPTGDMRELVASVKKLFALKGDYRVCTGHGEGTSLDYERRYNPYVK